jgi:hypothetical protein
MKLLRLAAATLHIELSLAPPSGLQGLCQLVLPCLILCIQCIRVSASGSLAALCS